MLDARCAGEREKMNNIQKEYENRIAFAFLSQILILTIPIVGLVIFEELFFSIIFLVLLIFSITIQKSIVEKIVICPRCRCVAISWYKGTKIDLLWKSIKYCNNCGEEIK